MNLETFNKLSKAKAAVQIATDVLKQLKARRLIASSGYLCFEGISRNYGAHNNRNKQMQELVAGKRCEVCGIGALFVAAVDIADDITLGQYWSEGSQESIRRYLVQWFDARDIQHVERAYEGWDNYADVTALIPRSQRLELIMKNIVRNEGRFEGAEFLATAEELADPEFAGDAEDDKP